MISEDLARRFIERVSRHTDYNVNVMDENGIIIASRDSSRVGQYHEVAYRIVHGTEDVVDTTESDGRGVQAGINMVLSFDRHREGVVGVTGDPEEIRPVAMVLKMAMETMLKYERQQEQERRRKNVKENFLYLLTQADNADPEELRSMGRELGFPEDCIRVPILIRSGRAGDRVLHMLRTGELHDTGKDMSMVIDTGHVLVFKSLPMPKERIFAEYRPFLERYLSCLDDGRRPEEAAFVGSFQERFPEYIHAFRQCRWLEDRHGTDGEIVWFYDFAGSYLRGRIPRADLRAVFQVYVSRIPEKKRAQFVETGEALLASNFNFPQASARLFIHKNTLVYRYNGMKQILQIDPVISQEDRDFLADLCSYMRRDQWI